MAAFLIFTSLVYGVNHGVYVGSHEAENDGMQYKFCRHLFITGIAQSPAEGATEERIRITGPGTQLSDRPDGLYCRLFKD
jgi:hypothetical protein